MKKTKFKEWIEEHKGEVILDTVLVAAGAIGGVCLYKYSNRDFVLVHKDLNKTYKALMPVIKDSIGIYMTYNMVNGETIKDCPKLIEELLECDFVNHDDPITGVAVFCKKK